MALNGMFSFRVAEMLPRHSPPSSGWQPERRPCWAMEIAHGASAGSQPTAEFIKGRLNRRIGLITTTPTMAFLGSCLSRPILDRLDHDITRRVLPHYHEWSAAYGKTFLFWFGSLPRLAVADPAIVRELVRDSGGGLDKVEFNPQSKQLFGEGLVGLKGKKWALHRRIINPTFNMERVKSWVPEIATCASNAQNSELLLSISLGFEREAGGARGRRGTEVFIPIGAVNRDMELWGDDACRFDPLRFSDGRRRPAGAYLPFGFGRTICVGQNLP
ncbi:unnamed protein product [Spirodela intermedia]|uniref:Uncharacterized protein n=1 Tax=Spirodela intermedia TaxID=51605 RepID=A0A7I8JTI7_SPIIN|nr:unnamed protein product [Spirodela intermedia]CAA6672762.1 unnamed protein product [Spirodela intermedia]